jgi:malonyl-CoA O-methyltransferase
LSLLGIVNNLLNPIKILPPGEAYRLWAPSYDDRGRNAVLHLEEKVMVPLLSNCMLPGKKVIDFGCGTGRHVLHCQELGATDIVGVDASIEMLSVAKEKIDASCVNLLQAHLEELPFAYSSFDVGIAALVLNHVKNIVGVVGGMSNLLRPGGMLLISDLHWTFNGRGWKRTFRSNAAPSKRFAVHNHVHSLSDYQNAFAKAGLQVEKMMEPPIDVQIEPFFRDAAMEKTYDRYRGQPLLVVFQLRKQ